jgi:uncharacterized protein
VNTITRTRQLPMIRIILLVFAPAILLLLSFVLSSVFLRNDIPVDLCLLLSIIVVIIPFEIAVVMITSKKEYGKFGLKAALANHEPLPVWQIILIGFISFAWAGVIFAVLQPIENSLLLHSVFRFVPDYLRSTEFFSQLATFPRPLIAVTCVVNLIFNGFIGPIVEELYFRGYLMSGMTRFGKAAPLLVAILFSVYHLFTPWEIITRIVGFTPLHYIAWKKKNLVIGMLTHCACNLAGAIALFSLLFAK